jgi:hypothetical protein
MVTSLMWTASTIHFRLVGLTKTGLRNGELFEGLSIPQPARKRRAAKIGISRSVRDHQQTVRVLTSDIPPHINHQTSEAVEPSA